jgi:hypothetical protein
MKTISVFATVLAVIWAFPSDAAAQFNNRSADRVCFYPESNYRGPEQCFNAGYEASSFAGRRVNINSIRVYGGAVLVVFDNAGFGGRSLQFDRDIPDLARYVSGSRNWNGRINSIRITQIRPNRGGPPRGQQAARDVVCVYEHIDYRGASECFESGDQIRDFGRRGGWNDRISSIRVFGRASALFYQDVAFGGREVYVNQDIPDLGRLRMERSDSWNDQISSVYVESTQGGRGGRDFGRAF